MFIYHSTLYGSTSVPDDGVCAEPSHGVWGEAGNGDGRATDGGRHAPQDQTLHEVCHRRLLPGVGPGSHCRLAAHCLPLLRCE